ncbi:MAG: ATP-dependent dethiobiotin synthetase BioD, partial [Bacteroidota bacterium]
SLLTINALLARGLKTAVVFSGNEHPTTEEIILKKTGILMLGRISEEAIFDKKTIKRYAALLRPNLLAFE